MSHKQRRNMESINEMIRVLESNLRVIGLIEYGSSVRGDTTEAGDYDLFVVLDERPFGVESLHFYVSRVPVDLNLITVSELKELEESDSFRIIALQNGTVLYDSNGLVRELLEKVRRMGRTPPVLSDHSIAMMRHGHRHVFDKIENRYRSMPTFCRFLLGVNIYWLVESYLRVRGLDFKGGRRAFEYLQVHEPKLYDQITRFYAAVDIEEQVEISRSISETVLAPVGGMWQEGEVLSFGETDVGKLQELGLDMYNILFGDELAK